MTTIASLFAAIAAAAADAWNPLPFRISFLLIIAGAVPLFLPPRHLFLIVVGGIIADFFSGVFIGPMTLALLLGMGTARMLFVTLEARSFVVRLVVACAALAAMLLVLVAFSFPNTPFVLILRLAAVQYAVLGGIAALFYLVFHALKYRSSNLR